MQRPLVDPRQDQQSFAVAFMLGELQQLQYVLQTLEHPRSVDVAQLVVALQNDEPRFWRMINDNTIWGGAGSLAADTMVDNPGLPEPLWQAEILHVRELLVAIGGALVARGGENPGIRSWLLAFENWKNAGVV